MLKETQERSLENHSWLPALDPPGSTMCAAGDTMGSLQPENCSWGHKPPVGIPEVLRDSGVHTEPCGPCPR